MRNLLIKIKSFIYLLVKYQIGFIFYLNLLILKDKLFSHKRKFYILNYHQIIPNERKRNSSLLQDWSISKKNFEFQMKYLSKRYPIISLDDLVSALKGKVELSSISLVITLDDGYKDSYTNAYPILKKYNIPATLFLISNYIGKRNRFGNYLSWNEIKKMKDSLIAFGSHTKTHSLLTQITENKLQEEILSSKLEIEKKLRKKIYFLAYPYGQTNETIKIIVKKTGYLAAFSTEDGQENDLFDLKRITATV